jgi:hypothetical protein
VVVGVVVVRGGAVVEALRFSAAVLLFSAVVLLSVPKPGTVRLELSVERRRVVLVPFFLWSSARARNGSALTAARRSRH